MTSIDQRILIPTMQNIVWDYISNLANNPDWQVDCRSVAFLTTQHQGQGVRWRATQENGREYVGEITAWYDRLGYEYHFIDGAPYKQNAGRLRLQEIPEGTIVQWTFEYEPGGLFGGFRNTVSIKRSIEATMQDSLWTLWRHLNKGSREIDFETKSLIREAPDVESRAQYRPRHPSVMDEYATKAPSATPEPLMSEPPVAEDDTRPRPAVNIPASAPRTEVPIVSASLSAAPMMEDSDTMPPMPEPDFLSGYTEQEVDFDQPTNPRGFENPMRDDQSPMVIEPVSEDSGAASLMPAISLPEEQDTYSPTFPADRSSTATSTAERSIFEIFGVPKPSETQEQRAVQVEPPIPADATPTPRPQPTVVLPLPAPTILMVSSGRRGRRVLARTRLVKVRRPG